MKTKIIPLLISTVMVMSPVTAFAKGFSGGHSSYHSQTHSNTYHSGGSFNNGTSNRTNGNTYHSGYKSSSANVTNQSRHNSIPTATPAAPSKTRSILTHAAAFGAGALIGSMFHPFGGGQSAVGAGGFDSQAGSSFSFLGLLLDILVIVLIIWVVRKLFFKRNA